MSSRGSKNIIVERLCRGDEVALKLLFDRYYRSLLSIAQSYTLTKEEGEDLVQSVFLWLWEKASKNELVVRDSLHGYLITAVRN